MNYLSGVKSISISERVIHLQRKLHLSLRLAACVVYRHSKPLTMRAPENLYTTLMLIKTRTICVKNTPLVQPHFEVYRVTVDIGHYATFTASHMELAILIQLYA